MYSLIVEISTEMNHFHLITNDHVQHKHMPWGLRNLLLYALFVFSIYQNERLIDWLDSVLRCIGHIEPYNGGKMKQHVNFTVRTSIALFGIGGI